METWRLLKTWDASPAFAMGLDDALLCATGATPTLRLYTWQPDTLSLGYFQRRRSVPDADQASAVVRRITGGGAIHHIAELTFSITVERDHALYAGPVEASYRRVHAAVIDALQELGLNASLREDRTLSSDRESTGMCFHHSTPLDIAWNGRKGVGTAQRRTKERILHHGSIKLGSSDLEGSIATVAECGQDLSFAQLGERLVRAMAGRFEIDWQEGEVLPSEREAARRLGERFIDPAFVARR